MQETKKIIYMTGTNETKDVTGTLIYHNEFTVTSLASAIKDFYEVKQPNLILATGVDIKGADQESIENFQEMIDRLNSDRTEFYNKVKDVQKDLIKPEVYKLYSFEIFIFEIKELKNEIKTQLRAYTYKLSDLEPKETFRYTFNDREINKAITGHKDFWFFLETLKGFKEDKIYFEKAVKQLDEPHADVDVAQRKIENAEAEAFLSSTRLKNYITDFYKEADNIQKKRKTKAIRQENFKVPESFSWPMQKTVRQTFIEVPSAQELLDEEMIIATDVAGRNALEPIYNYVTLKTSKEMDYFDYVCYSGYYTLWRLNPDKCLTYLDIAQTIHKAKGGKKLQSGDAFVLEVEKSIEKMRTTLGYFDFTKEAQSHKNKELKKLLDFERTTVNVNLIYAVGIDHIRKNNDHVLSGIKPINDPDAQAFGSLFFEYINATKQIKTLDNAYLRNPLRASKDNVSIFHYMLYKLSGMPYYQKDKFLTTQNTGDAPRSALVDDKQCTINIDTMINDLKLDPKRKNRYTERMEKILDFWIKENYIRAYDIIKDGRSKVAYLLSID